jgi:hypothetical protein
MIGSGVRHGMHGTALGIGDIIRVGGTITVAGHMTGIGITAMHGIITITTALSVTDIIPVMVFMTCMDAYRVENMLLLIRTTRSAAVTRV